MNLKRLSVMRRVAYAGLISIALPGGSSAAQAPSAFTQSVVNVSILIDEVAIPEANIILTASAGSITKAMAMASNAAHQAAATADVAITKEEAAQYPDVYLEAAPLAALTIHQATLAQSASNSPLFARSASASIASILNIPIYDLGLITGQSSSLLIQWDIDSLTLESGQFTSYTRITDFIDITQHLGDESTTTVFGIEVEANGGELRSNCIEPAYSSVLREQFCDPLSNSDELLRIAEDLQTLSVSLPLSVLSSQAEAATPFSWLTLTHHHEEHAYAAPLVATPQVAQQAGHYHDNGSTPAIHWDSENSLFRIDPLPLDALSGGAIDKISNLYSNDALIGGHLEIDPLRYTSGLGTQRYFSGEELRLLDSAGNILLRAKLPSLLFDDQLYSSQGFNLFAPILNIAGIEIGHSAWLDDFAERLPLDSEHLPELFLGFNVSALPVDFWGQDFSMPVNGVLSFAGPFVEVNERAVPAPSTLLLLLMGLAAWTYVHGKHRPRYKCQPRPLNPEPATNQLGLSGDLLLQDSA